MLWGGLHGAAPVGGALGRERFGPASVPAWVAWLVTFNFVCVAWVFFRAPDLATAFDILGGLGLSGPSPLVTLPLVLLVVAAIAIQAVPREWWLRGRGLARRAARGGAGPGRGRGHRRGRRGGGQQGVAPFIYYQF